jgi:hypothetical protein
MTRRPAAARWCLGGNMSPAFSPSVDTSWHRDYPMKAFGYATRWQRKGTNTMTYSDSHVVRDRQRRCNDLLRSLKRPRPCQRCGARTRTADRHPCRKWAMANGRCALHGGKALCGTASPRFRHGRYSTLLPLHLAERYYCLHPEERPRPRVRHRARSCEDESSEGEPAHGGGTSGA